MLVQRIQDFFKINDDICKIGFSPTWGVFALCRKENMKKQICAKNLLELTPVIVGQSVTISDFQSALSSLVSGEKTFQNKKDAPRMVFLRSS